MVAQHSAPVDVALMCLSSAPYDLALNKRVFSEINFDPDSFVKLVFARVKLSKFMKVLAYQFMCALVSQLTGGPVVLVLLYTTVCIQ